MLTKQDLEAQRELIQDDLITMLDGLDSEFLNNVCNMICKRFSILIEKNENDSNARPK